VGAFWLINKNGNAQKTKVVYYTREGKRTEYFKVPFKNEDGYYSCLFGEHLLNDNSKPIILVESAKTALVASIVLPHYTWLSYGGMNGLTNDKIKVLAGETIIIILDMSSKAVKMMQDKTPTFQELDIDARILDITTGFYLRFVN
jgi:hypothetical protein